MIVKPVHECWGGQCSAEAGEEASALLVTCRVSGGARLWWPAVEL